MHPAFQCKTLCCDYSYINNKSHSFLAFLLVGDNLEARGNLFLRRCLLGHLTPSSRHVTTSRDAAGRWCVGWFHDTLFSLLTTANEFFCKATTVHQSRATVDTFSDELLVEREGKKVVEEIDDYRTLACELMNDRIQPYH